jgi:hypothetical protein
MNIQRNLKNRPRTHSRPGQFHIPAMPASAAARVRQFVKEPGRLTSSGYNIPVVAFKYPGVRSESDGMAIMDPHGHNETFNLPGDATFLSLS